MWGIGARKVAALATVSVCALLAGVRLGWRDLAAFAKDLSVAQMAALGLRREGRPRRYRPTGETTCSPTRTAGRRSGPSRLGRTTCWASNPVGDQVAFDGQAARHDDGLNPVSAFSSRSRRAAARRGFDDAMAAKPARKTFRLVTTSHPSGLPKP